jgi:hypothetical protein
MMWTRTPHPFPPITVDMEYFYIHTCNINVTCNVHVTEFPQSKLKNSTTNEHSWFTQINFSSTQTTAVTNKR